MYSDPDENSEVIASNVKAFWPVYVFERKDIDYSDGANPKGWYRVGPMQNDPLGWMQAKDVLEWKQSLVISYKHPGSGEDRRQSVLMFKTKEDLATVVESSERETMVATLYANLEGQSPAVDDRLISREPKRFVAIEQKFYMLPVIDFESVDLFDQETRYLQLAAAVPVQAGDTRNARSEEGQSDTLQDSAFIAETGLTETIEGTSAKDLLFDVKFVMDMTGSMGPYIDRTKEAVSKVAQTVVRDNPEAKVRFGLVGYRDDLRINPALEFVAKNFTSEMVEADKFVEIISNAKATEVSSEDYQEEVFAGVSEAITSNWNENSLKFVVLVGDASSHQVGHPQNTTGLDANEVRASADANKVSVFALHIRDERAQPDHALAEHQFRKLATNPGSPDAAYLSIPAFDQDQFELGVKQLSDDLAVAVANVRTGNLPQVMAYTKPDSATSSSLSGSELDSDKTETQAAVSLMTQTVIANALIEYLGAAAYPPRDITAWILDRDLSDPENVLNTPVEVRVLLKKSQVNDLIRAMEDILKAVKRSQLTGMQFFDALQGVLAQATKGGGGSINVKDAQRLSDSGLLPNWIASLPYRSAVMEINNETYEALAAEERAKLEYEIEAKLKLYQEINENTDLWVALDERDISDDHVYPLPLSVLP